MISTPTLRRVFWFSLTGLASVAAVFIVGDTLRAVVPLWSPLPWFDEWATVDLIAGWQDGTRTVGNVLFSQHNEHRILVPRLVFFADDLLFRGRGYLSLAAIFAVQLLHAGLFAAVLGRSRPARAGRWAIAAAVLAAMFSLRQDENFSSGFQLQFVAVFAGATLSFVLFGLAAKREVQRRPVRAALLASLGAALITTLTMANGLVVGYVLVVLALIARLRPRVALACAAFALTLTVVYLQGYEPVAHHAKPAESLHHPLRFLVYTASYLGSIVEPTHPGAAAGLGLFGLAVTAWAGIRIVRQGRDVRPGALAMLGAMLFVGATAVITAAGRLNLGVDQALSSRYVTGSVTFWAAQLTYWWIEPPRWRLRLGLRSLPTGLLGRVAVAGAAVLLVVTLLREQNGGEKSQLAVQSFQQNESGNALMLGLHDPVVASRAAWSDEAVQSLVPVLRDDGLSIFATRDFAAIGRPWVDRGRLGEPCGGTVLAAVADPALGPGGVRVSGRVDDRPHQPSIRRVFLADADGRIAGLASGAIPGAARGAWRGYAVAPVGAALTALGLVDGDALCRIGDATVAPPVQASQPEEAP